MRNLKKQHNLSTFFVQSIDIDPISHVVSHLRQELLKQGHLHIDETHVQVLKEPERKNTSDSYMWVYCSIRDQARPIRYFEYQPGRGGKYPEAFLKDYTGYIHTDAYSGYNGVKGVTRYLCCTHLRRAFVDALAKDIHDPKASKPAQALLRLNKLFEIEKELESLPPEQKKKERINREKPLLAAFWSWAKLNSAGELPKSKLHTAFRYALNNRQEFFNYLEDGNCSISNSLAEISPVWKSLADSASFLYNDVEVKRSFDPSDTGLLRSLHLILALLTLVSYNCLKNRKRRYLI